MHNEFILVKKSGPLTGRVLVSGAKNAALLAASILALSDEALRARLQAFRLQQTEAVLSQTLKGG